MKTIPTTPPRRVFRRAMLWTVIVQLLWSTVYSPVLAQVPPVNEDAGDWLVYRRSADTNQEGFINLLIILDSSDSMNQPESWRPYPGSYNSHVEYLWNDPIYINKIKTSNPPVPDSGGVGSDDVRIGFFTYHLNGTSSETDQNVQNTMRQQLKDAALADANTLIPSFDLDANGSIDSTEQNLSKWIYRNYGGPMEFASLHYNTYMWFHSSWIYFVPNGLVNVTNLANSPYLLSTSFSKFLGQNNQSQRTRASIPYRGQVDAYHLSYIVDGPGFNQHNRYDGIDYERFNVCDRSRYDKNRPALTGLGNVAFGIKPSTVYNPAYPGYFSKPVSGGAERDTTATPMVGYNTGFYRNINYVRFDPYFSSTQTRKAFIDNYPGPRNFDDPKYDSASPAFDVWPTDNGGFDYYHERSGNMNFSPAYIDLRCYRASKANPTTFNLDTTRFLKGTGLSFCRYEFKTTPQRNNFVAARFADTANDRYFGSINGDGTSGVADRQGMHGLPIRVLRYRLTPYSTGGDNTATPSTRHLQTTFGGCANSSGLSTDDEGPGRYRDYLCKETGELKSQWSPIRSDNGGFNFAFALYDLFSNIKKPDSGNNKVDTNPAERLVIIKNMLRAYGVNDLSTGANRWGKKNDGSAISPNDSSTTMFKAYLGNRDCVDFSSANLDHCAGFSSKTANSYKALVTGVPGYVDYTRTTYNFCVSPNGTAYNPTSAGCFITSASGAYSRSVNPVSGITYQMNYVTPASGSSWVNNSTDISLPTGQSMRFGPWPSSGGTWRYFNSTGAFSTSRENDVTPTEKQDYVVAFTNNGATNTQIVHLDVDGGNNYCSATGASANQVKVNGVAQTATPSVAVAVGEPLQFDPTPASGKWYWVGDGGYSLVTDNRTPTVTFAEGDAGKHYQYTGIHFNNSKCAQTVTYNISVLPTTQVRSNTFKVYDTNIPGTISSRNDVITSGVFGDNSDTTGLIANNTVYTDNLDGSMPFGAIEIRKPGASTAIPADFKQYRRQTACNLDKSTMKLVYADSPNGGNATSFYYTQPTCERKDLSSGGAYDKDTDCEVQTGGSGVWVPVPATSTADREACDKLPEPTCGFSPASNAIRASVANFYAYQGCQTFGKSTAFEGGSSTVVGKSCGVAARGDFYVVDWDNTGQTDTSNLVALFNNNNVRGFNYSGGTFTGQFKSIGELGRGCARYVSTNPGATAVGLVAQANGNLVCNFSNSSDNNANSPVRPTGLFQPTYYQENGSIYTLFNASGGNCGNKVPAYNLRSITEPTLAINGNTDFLRLDNQTVTPGSFCTGTTDTEAETARNNHTVGSCVATAHYSSGAKAQLRDDVLPANVDSDFRLIQAFNVLRHGSRNYGQNSALVNPSNGAGYIPHFIHTCKDALPGIGDGSASNWDDTTQTTRYSAKFENFYKAKEQMRSWLYPKQYQENEPIIQSSTFNALFNTSGAVSTSSTDGTAIDLYSVNYLNFVFGPKYNGNPIGRRTRFQLAQDTLAEFISETPTRVRMGLMFFNQTAATGSWANHTNGGYVAKRIAQLEAKSCTTFTTNFTVSSNGTQLTSVASVDTWFERVPNPSGGAGIPANVRTNLLTGGRAKFPDGTTAQTYSIDDNGTITLVDPAPSGFRGNTYSIEIENCNLANYPALTGHRAELINTLYSKLASSQTPLTETLYEAYLYFKGGTPKFGKYFASAKASEGSPEADIKNYGTNARGISEANGVFTDSSYNQYLSPLKTIVGPDSTVDYAQCSLNNILLITDGHSNGDYKANNAIASLPVVDGVAVNLVNDTNGIIRSSEIVSSTVLSETTGTVTIGQFKDPSTGIPFGPVDQREPAQNSYALFDELAYYIGQANIAPDGVSGRHNIKLYTAALDIDCSPVIENAVKRNRNGKCAQIDTGTDDLKNLLASILSQLNQWVPSVNTVAVPLPSVNRSSSSVDSFMGLFLPDGGLRVWRGNMKKYKLAFGPVDCGTDYTGSAIDVCLVGKNVLLEYNYGTTRIQSRNVFTRPSSQFDISIDQRALDYWSPTPSTEPLAQIDEGTSVFKGGVAANMVSENSPASNNNTNKVYTFVRPVSDNGAFNWDGTTPNPALAHSSNNVNNTVLNNYRLFGSMTTPSHFTVMPSTEASTALPSIVNFMLGRDSDQSDVATWRSQPHGDVMHSPPAVVNYLNGTTKTSRVFYLTGNGDLVSVKDEPTGTATDNGKIAWRFYPTESLRRQYEIMKNYNESSASTKIFGADGAVSVLYFDKNNDGFINTSSTSGDRVYISFGMRRGARAIYVLDVTDPDAPQIQWTMNNEGMCYRVSSSGAFQCEDLTGFKGVSTELNNLPDTFFSELGYTWSTPLMGFVNRKARYSGAYENVYKVKGSSAPPTPVVIFGGGYDPEEDYQNPDRTKSVKMGRALYVMEALTGLPIKFWHRGSSATASAKQGAMITYTTNNCRNDLTVNNNPIDYPIASPVYGMNVDYDAANTIDRLYVGDTGGQLFRFDIGDFGSVSDNVERFWRGTLMGRFNGQTTYGESANASSNFDYEVNLEDASNKQTVGGVSLYRRARKFLQQPVVASWTRKDNSGVSRSLNYVYAITGDIDHPWTRETQDVAIALVDPEIGMKMKCAPTEVAQIGNAKNTTPATKSIYYLPDITNVGRVDVNGDGVIDRKDISTPSAVTSANEHIRVSTSQLSLLPAYSTPSATTTYTRSASVGMMGWYYRMEKGEKGVSQPRVIDGQLTWTAFAALFSSAVCSVGTGTKYAIDAFWGINVDTNNDGKVSNCLAVSDDGNIETTSLLKAPPATTPSTYIKTAEEYEARLRTPIEPANTSLTAGQLSLRCDSPRPIYNTSYGLLANDIQVAKDGQLYRVGVNSQGNKRDIAYDDQGNFLGNNWGQSLSSTTKAALASTATATSAQKLSTDDPSRTAFGGTLGNTTTGKTDAEDSKKESVRVGLGAATQQVRRPAQLYWFRDELR